MRRALFVLATLTLAAAPSLCFAVLHDGPELQINTYTTGEQQGRAARSVASNTDGSFVVVWTSYGYQPAENSSIRGQRFDAAGTALGTEFRVNSYTTTSHYHAAVSSAPDGSFVVVWMSVLEDRTGQGIRGQRYDDTGAPAGTEFKVNGGPDTYQSFADVASAANGSFVVVWDTYLDDGDGYGIHGRRYDAVGAPAGTEFEVNVYTTGNQELPSISSAPDGSFVVVWQGPGTTGTVHGRRFDATSAALGAEFQLATYTTGVQGRASVSVAPDASFVAVWEASGLFSNPGPDGSLVGIEGQRFDSTGATIGTEFQVNTYTTGRQSEADVSSASDGSFVVVWSSYHQDGSHHAVRGRRFDATGAPEEGEFHVNTYTTGIQDRAAVSSAPDGTFTVVWSSRNEDGSSFGVFGQRFNLAPGTTTTTNTVITTTTTLTTISNTTTTTMFPPTTIPSTTTTTTESGTTTTVGGGTTTTLGGGGTTTTLGGGGPSACPSSPAIGCLAPGKTSMQLRRSTDGTKDQLKWKWSKGPLVEQDDLGNPETTTTYTLCIYDSTGGVDTFAAELTIEPNANWDDNALTGWRYKDGAGSEDGVQKVHLRTGADGKSAAQIRAKGPRIPMPAPLSPTEIFDQDPRVTVQLINDTTSTCWTSVFTTAMRNTAEQFRAP